MSVNMTNTATLCKCFCSKASVKSLKCMIIYARLPYIGNKCVKLFGVDPWRENLCTFLIHNKERKKEILMSSKRKKESYTNVF